LYFDRKKALNGIKSRKIAFQSRGEKKVPEDNFGKHHQNQHNCSTLERARRGGRKG
jgi:hypothetical protein